MPDTGENSPKTTSEAPGLRRPVSPPKMEKKDARSVLNSKTSNSKTSRAKPFDQAQESYHTARKRLTDGRGNLLRQIEMLRELSAENSKELPEEMEEELAGANLPRDEEVGSNDGSNGQPGSNHSAGDPPGKSSPDEEA